MSDYNYIMQHVVQNLEILDLRTPTDEIIRQEIENAYIELIRLRNIQEFSEEISIDRDRIFYEIQQRYTTIIQPSNVLDDPSNHIEWLNETRKRQIQWSCWNHYKKYLRDIKFRPESVIEDLDNVTFQLLEYLEEPERSDNYDRRGMVVGLVQSGKTQNFLGLISKAIDAGYHLIIILTGMTNELRAQTQKRVDEGILGYDTRRNITYNRRNIIGVGTFVDYAHPIIHSLTSSILDGDFNRDLTRRLSIRLSGSDPIILVMKKNVSILENFREWAGSSEGIQLTNSQESERQLYRISDIPLILIDDEADYASINYAPDGEDPTLINARIRDILQMFEKSVYIGYTATPFANIFIQPPDIRELYEDLFPRDFIINLNSPSNYIGAVRIFGIPRDEYFNSEPSEGLPIIRIVDDYDNFLPDRHNIGHIPILLPNSLQNAIISFILSCCVRCIRGEQTAHNSMLIHVTRFQAVQNLVGDLVRREIRQLNELFNDSENAEIHEIYHQFEEIWENDFLRTTQQIRTILENPFLNVIGWNEIREIIPNIINSISIRVIHGASDDELNYSMYQNGLNAIIIGGNKLSRGLTLEGLTVSYFLRTSHTYDTLMQMGRWFGYKESYIDACRLYTTRNLINWFRHITLANEELRREFDIMAQLGRSPRDFGLKIRNSQQGLNITSLNKIRGARTFTLSYNDSVAQTGIFKKDIDIINENLRALRQLISGIGNPELKNSHFIWNNVNPQNIIQFIDDYNIHPDSRRIRGELIIRYIESQREEGELIEWTIALINIQRGRRFFLNGSMIGLSGYQIGCSKRADETKSEYDYTLLRQQLLDRTHEAIDLSDSQIEEARNQQFLDLGERSDFPSPRYIRMRRPSTKGLIVVYLLDYNLDYSELDTDPNISNPYVAWAISFPNSPTAQSIEYTANEVYIESENDQEGF